MDDNGAQRSAVGNRTHCTDSSGAFARRAATVASGVNPPGERPSVGTAIADWCGDAVGQHGDDDGAGWTRPRIGLRWPIGHRRSVHIIVQNFPNEIGFRGGVRLTIIPADAREVSFQFRIPLPNRGLMPQEVTETNVVSPLTAALFDDVKMDRPDLRRRLHDKYVASRIAVIASVTVANGGQPLQEFAHRVERHHRRSDV